MEPKTIVRLALPRSYFDESGDGYRLRDDANWLARRIWRFLQWLDMLKRVERTSERWTFTRAAQRDLFQHVAKAIDECCDHENISAQDVIVLCGTQTFREIVHTAPNWPGFYTEIGPVNRNEDFGRKRLVMDVPLHVLPYMEGLIAVPRKSLLDRNVR